MAAAGLQTHIWNNNLKSGLMLASYPVILMAIVWACATAIGFLMTPELARRTEPPQNAFWAASELGSNIIIAYWPVIVAIVGIWFVISYFLHNKMIAGMAHAHPITRKEEPELYNLLENLCISKGVAMPQFNIIETHALNAFASGIDEKSYTITVTRGLLNRLSKDEVEAVLGHELTHILNRDVRLMMISIVFVGMIGLAAQMAWSYMRFAIFFPRSGRKGGRAIIAVLIVMVILWIGYFASMFTRFAISRKREYMADAGAIEMTKNPAGMMRALMRISGRDRIPETTDDIGFMCIENTKPFLGLFATHPPIDQRIETISQTTGTPVPTIQPRAAKEEQISNESQQNPWLTRSRGFRQKQNPWK